MKINQQMCDICGACLSICPNLAIDIFENKTEINSKCIACKLCIAACPVGAITNDEEI